MWVKMDDLSIGGYTCLRQFEKLGARDDAIVGEVKYQLGTPPVWQTRTYST